MDTPWDREAALGEARDAHWHPLVRGYMVMTLFGTAHPDACDRLLDTSPGDQNGANLRRQLAVEGVRWAKDPNSMDGGQLNYYWQFMCFAVLDTKHPNWLESFARALHIEARESWTDRLLQLAAHIARDLPDDD